MDPPDYASDMGHSAAPSLRPNGASTSSVLLPVLDPVVLAWNPLQLLDEVNSQTDSSQSTGFSAMPLPNPVHSNTSPAEDPPAYIAARRPTEPIKYSFSNISFNSMLLIPPEDAPDTRPLYRITVTMNCFMPTSFITTIMRGATEYGDYVAEFEMGISANKSTVTIGETEYLIRNMLTSDGGSRWQMALWTWNRNATRFLTWNFKTIPATCRLLNRNQSQPVATFFPATRLRRPGHPPVLSELVVSPEGQEHFDDILISLLIIERRRLTPAQSCAKDLFN